MASSYRLKCGAPQGSVLGPKLYFVYVNATRFYGQDVCIITFADDTDLTVCAKSIGEVVLKVFVRIRPTNEIKSKCLQTQGNEISIQSLGNKRINRFNFSEVLPETAKQKEVFDKAVLEPVTELLHGEDALVLTYGATSAGKTFTMLGTTEDIGILPRSIDVIFNSLGPTLSTGQYLKPER
ncbi:kinesin-like protein KIF20A [Artemia franciscana]|uniref:kinesin-like protein KIF20A n=1 Tax=Artemia franciscana TaxID=6661 RepID=UPI0032DAC6B5